jgi:rod shape-determining protein MreD
MRKLLGVLIVLVAVMLQLSFLPALRLAGIVPNLALVTMVLVALNIITSEALMLAAGAGFVLDIASGVNFGLWTGVLMLTSLVIGLLQRAGIETGRAFIGPVLVVAGTIIIAIVIWLGLATSGAGWPGAQLVGRLGIELVINLGLTLLLNPVVRTIVGSGARSEVGG